MKLPLLAAGVVVGAHALVGCNTNDGSCERIVEACHEKDTGTGKPHACHEFAEDPVNTDDECAAHEDECLDACE